MTAPAFVPAWPDAGQFLGLGRTTTFEMISSGAIPSVKLGRKRMVPIEALHEFAARLVANQVPGNKPTTHVLVPRSALAHVIDILEATDFDDWSEDDDAAYKTLSKALAEAGS